MPAAQCVSDPTPQANSTRQSKMHAGGKQRECSQVLFWSPQNVLQLQRLQLGVAVKAVSCLPVPLPVSLPANCACCSVCVGRPLVGIQSGTFPISCADTPVGGACRVQCNTGAFACMFVKSRGSLGVLHSTHLLTMTSVLLSTYWPDSPKPEKPEVPTN
jgi:hypothetical protein